MDDNNWLSQIQRRLILANNAYCSLISEMKSQMVLYVLLLTYLITYLIN